MIVRSLALTLLAALAAACGGSYSPASASTLAYTDPSSAGWRLVKDPASTSARLVLALVGPAGLPTRGVGLNLRAPEGVRFATFAGGALLEDAGVYELRSVEDDPAEPVAIAGGVKDGNVLSVGLYQKDRRRSAKGSGVTLLRVALELDPAAAPRKGTRLALEVPKAGAIPEDIGAATDPGHLLAPKLALTPLEVSLGTLVAR